jgi:hypothetical protein
MWTISASGTYLGVVPLSVPENLQPLHFVGHEDGERAQVGVRREAQRELRLRARRVEVDLLQEHEVIAAERLRQLRRPSRVPAQRSGARTDPS